MSGQICRYYLKGICKYGSRCHFLHDNSDTSYKENYSGYSNGSYHDKYYSAKANVPSQDYGSGGYYDRNSSSGYNNRNANNYSRYHVDHRRSNQPEIKSTSLLTEEEILDVINQELREFEGRRIWYFSVIAPLKDLGNVPGFKDLSPEELRYQYYESSMNNSFPDFLQNLNMARNEVAQVCQIFLNRSAGAYEIVRSMVQKSVSTSGEEMTTDYQSNAASTFKFDLNSLPNSSSFPTQSVQSFIHQFSQVPLEVPSAGSSLSGHDFSNNFSNSQQPLQMAAFSSGATSDVPHQQNAPMSSFSFNLNQLQPNQSDYSSNVNPSVSESSTVSAKSVFNNNFHSITSNPTVFNSPNSSGVICESIYSRPDQIPHDAVVAFQAKSFQLGSIPLIPPSEELCFK